MNRLLIILILMALFSACGTQPTVDPAAVQNAIQQTVSANWTATFTPRPTSTITPTWTPTATATDTPTPTFTDTPTMTASPSPTPDLRVIEISYADFILSAYDLPPEAGYAIMEHHSSFSLGSNVHDYVFRYSFAIASDALGIESSDFLTNDFAGAWWIKYERGISRPIYPQTIAGTVISFRSVEGARLMISDYSLCTHPNTEYSLVETDLQIGDVAQYCTNVEMESTGYRGYYTIVFSYRNYYHAIEAYGWEREVPLEVLEGVARNLLARLEAAPLSDAATYQP